MSDKDDGTYFSLDMPEPYSDCKVELLNYFGGSGPKLARHPYRDSSSCIYCSSTLREHIIPDHLSRVIQYHGWTNLHRFGREDLSIHHIHLKECPTEKCGWWVFRQDLEWGYGDAAKSYIHSGQFRIFNVDQLDAEILELRREIKYNPTLIFSTHHESFEKLMAACIRDKFPGATVQHVGRSGDGGVDIYAVIGGKPCLIQVKRRTNEGVAEGPRAVRELNGVLLREGVYCGMLITTAQRFTEAAKKETSIKMETREPLRVDLVALDGVLDLIRETAGMPPVHAWTASQAWKNLFVPHKTDKL